MSDEHIQPGGNGGFEREDLGARPIFGFLIGLAVMGLLVYFVVRGTYSVLDHYNQAHQPVRSPLKKTSSEADMRATKAAETSVQINNTFPEPRLETDERNEINDFRMHEEEQLNSYGWIDQPGGVVHIPIDRAMQLVAQRGLPVRPAGESSPPADKKKKP